MSGQVKVDVYMKFALHLHGECRCVHAAEECICVRLRMTGKPATNLREKIFVEKCPNLRAGHGTLREKMVLKF